MAATDVSHVSLFWLVVALSNCLKMHICLGSLIKPNGNWKIDSEVPEWHAFVNWSGDLRLHWAACECVLTWTSLDHSDILSLSEVHRAPWGSSQRRIRAAPVPAVPPPSSSTPTSLWRSSVTSSQRCSQSWCWATWRDSSTCRGASSPSCWERRRPPRPPRAAAEGASSAPSTSWSAKVRLCLVPAP